MTNTQTKSQHKIDAILSSLHAGITAQELNDMVAKVHALLYPTGCPGGGCESCVSRP